MLTISEKANKNYLAKVVQLKSLRQHENADRLQVETIDFQNVITGMDAKNGDICVFFPLEVVINLGFLAHTNYFRHTNLNAVQNDNKPGFFEDNGRVRAVRLRGEKSMGYLVPVASLDDWLGFNTNWNDYIGQEFDTIKDKLMLTKYVIKTRENNPNTNKGKKPKVSRLIDGQVRLHIDTENLRKEVWKIKPEDLITVTYKYHGTSFWVANVLVKRKLSFVEKILKAIGVRIQETEYDHVHGSRKVVKNSDMLDVRYSAEKLHFYGYDLWGEIKEELKEFVPKGYTVYGECVGYLADGKEIQKSYDYGVVPGKKKIYVYRITFTNGDGLVNDLSSVQVKQYCEHFGLNYVHTFYHGKAKDMYPDIPVDKWDGDDEVVSMAEAAQDDRDRRSWHKDLIARLEKDYNDKDCFVCKNAVPEEGIVVRRESLFSFDAYKLKSFKFLEYETKQLDTGEEDLESEN